ncbi:MAG: DUF808 domain-containing protein [Chitinophagaceae bacterium]|nr:DUF808 domain-containing protein [Chitinophagaceae bacterium]MCW5905710.1 DUF808 domain-containing protein [Chitinophagaceae bacterium]
MASGFFALLDDIGALMDDVALTTKVATKKTAGILGDDLAVNAEKSTGFTPSKELPVLWAITKGSFVNKLIIIPIVFLLNVYLPIAITIILMVGGAYLAYEGAEKIIDYFLHQKHSKKNDHTTIADDNNIHAEKKKINDAIRTDFILSLEIVIIALSTVLEKELWLRITTVSAVAIIATIGVYGIVALIVRMDDVGFSFIKQSNGKGFLGLLGKLLVNSLPKIIKLLSVIGTIALLMVAGGLFLHNVSFIHHFVENIPELLASIIIGLVIGILVFLLVWVAQKIIAFSKKLVKQ